METTQEIKLTVQRTSNNMENIIQAPSPSQIVVENDVAIIKPKKRLFKRKTTKTTKTTKTMKETLPLETLYKTTVEILKEKLENSTIRVDTVHLVIKYIMELTEDTPFKGENRKEFALKVMREVFIDLTEGEDEKILLKLLDDGVISNMIDLIIDASKGKLNINTAINTSYTCLSLCLPLFIKKTHKA